MTIYLAIAIAGIIITQFILAYFMKQAFTAQIDNHMRTLDARVREMDPLMRKYETSVIVASRAADSLKEQSDRLEAMYAFTGKTAQVLAKISEQRKAR